MSESTPQPHLSSRILEVVCARGPLTFTQIVHATRANRGSVWRLLTLLQRRGLVHTLTLHGRIHYVASSEGDRPLRDHC